MTQCTTPTSRKAVGKRTRFEVFKRDGFTCQYCGRRPPDVTLECDHITPVSKGGGNDPLNLITACRDCNAGKAAVELGDVRPSPDAEAMRLEVEQQIAEVRGYQEAAARLDEKMCELVDGLGNLWRHEFRTSHAPLDDISAWVRVYGPGEVRTALGIAGEKFGSYYPGVGADRKRYVGGILRNRQNARSGKTCDACRHHFGDGLDTACRLRPAGGEQFYCVHKNGSCARWESP